MTHEIHCPNCKRKLMMVEFQFGQVTIETVCRGCRRKVEIRIPDPLTGSEVVPRIYAIER